MAIYSSIHHSFSLPLATTAVFIHFFSEPQSSQQHVLDRVCVCACMHVCARVHVSVCGGEREWGGGLKQYSLAYSRASRWLWQCSTAHFRSFGVRGLKDIYSNTCQAFLKPERYLSQYMYLPGCFRASDISTPVLSHLYQKLKKYLQQYIYEPLSEPFIV